MPIQILPSNLSSQISSGEIIERPVSVIKELMENSIDAGSKNINIEIEKNGLQSIVLQDDGCGICKEELLLAISHHATSKISSLSDLDDLRTFGFRGEALASIRAVSRLTLISSYQSNDLGWKIYSENFMDNQDIILQPIAHPKGTTIIVENLFYNIPVRLKFIKNEKLEFLKICEIFRKIALSHFHINFSLKHNKKLIAKYNAIKKKSDKIHRLQDIFGKIDINKMIKIKSKINNLLLCGWISLPHFPERLENIRYIYVNNRCIRNNLILNAIRSAYSKIEANKNISFILYLTMPCNKIITYIHPTKNKIKFNNSNEIYVFIYESILFYLEKLKNKIFLKNTLFNKNDFQVYEKKELYSSESFYLNFFILISSYFSKNKIFSKNINTIKKKDKICKYDTYLKEYSCCFGRLLIIIRNYYGLIYHNDNFLLISFPVAKGIIKKKKLINNIQKKIIPESFLTNIKINFKNQEYMILLKNKEVLLKFGFKLIFKKKYIILNSIPSFFQKKNIDILISKFFLFLFFKKIILVEDVINWFYINVFIELKNWNYPNAISILLELEYYYPLLLKNPPAKLLQKVNINTALCMLKI
ncbi:DNA mismatch repair endonuclease MutL [Buchnera aphidicola]|uniref:DNA mismatch repair protein MutL n=1 Tax=Buchnera aphidicola str. USDA (Myzus persicae) TaxID=1009856 RepID=W0NZC2_BUCMP|nr:DNA mismatch repair endonuclease MutL [Buchnera aphidicola]AHG59836.1 Mutl [Buchnera aphidicola str. USDA (Myzus persicae)]AHG60416.1 Mutl [Buchnera aphidicola str. W106 (Myzus persicae)]AHG61561.1 Mutl [Buchnera aphidicola str. F009 (Myzus persicae)]WAI02923.1 MAG: DNA mismatch repair endonuclease MutL [Buchnera aphidicola (Myzus persicae)]